MTQPPPYRFCPRCGAPLDSRVVRVGEPPRLVCQACAFVFFLDPKIATGVVFALDDGIVLVQRAIHPAYGKWVFPGGYVDRGETLEAAALREVREESGLTVRLTRLLGAYSFAGHPVIMIAYAGKVTGGSLTIDEESLAIKTFPAAEIPWDELAFPSTVRALQDYLGLAPTGQTLSPQSPALKAPNP